MKNKSLPGILFSLAAGVCWGFSGTVGQFLFTTTGVNSGWLTTVRLISSGIILLLIAIFRKDNALKAIWQNQRDAVHLVFFAIAGLMMVQFTYLQAIYYTNSGTTTAIQYSGEAMILVYSCIVGRRLPKAAEFFGLLLALTGIFLLATHGNIHTMVLSRAGIFWGLLSAVGLMLYSVIPGKLVRTYGSTAVTGYGMIIGGLVLALLVRIWTIPVTVSPALVLGMSAIILIGTVAAFSLYLTSVAWIGPLKAGLLSAVETIAAPVISRVWLKTPFVGMDYFGFILILIMVVLFAVPEIRAAKTENESH